MLFKKFLAYTLPSRHPRHGFPAIEYEKLKQMNNSIYNVYVWYIPYIYLNIHGICMIYTIHIPYIIFIGVPDV